MSYRTFICCLLIMALPLSAKEQATLSFRSTEVAPGLFMLEGVGGFTGGNMALSVGDDGVMLIDDSLKTMSETVLAAVAKITTDPVDLVINTHVHGDHIGGNEVLGRAGATIIAHDAVRGRLIEHGVHTAEGPAEAPHEALPVLTFADAITLHLNGHKASVFHLQDAHTDGDAAIHFPDIDVIHCGDVLFNGLFPFVDLDSGGTLNGYIAAQEQLLALAGEKTRIIPGHGPLATKEDLAAAIAMLKDARQSVSALVAQGKSEEETVAARPLAKYEQWNWPFINAERMTKMLFRALSKSD